MKHLLRTHDLTRSDVESVMKLARGFAQVQSREVRKVPALRGRTIVMAFFEDSTRTRSSFDLAARRLSADVLNFSAGASSVKKGESIRDTIETLSAMEIDAIVIRHASSGVPQQITRWTDASVVNAGDGWHAHPTQALLDCFTLEQRFGSLEGLKIGICGDICHSRVARSNVDLFTKMGAEVTLVAPGTLLPPAVEGWPVTVEKSLDPIIGDLDVAYILRIQQERIAASPFPTLGEYRDRYGLTVERAARLRSDAVICHPGPMNRGVEIDPEVADDPRSLILAQVANGIPVRMAVLYWLLGPGRFDGAERVLAGSIAS